MAEYVVIRSALIETRDEAIAYFRARLAGTQAVEVYGRAIGLMLERDATHFYSEDVKGAPIAAADLVERRLPTRIEQRRFALDRALYLDAIIPAVRGYVVSLRGRAAAGRENFELFGPVFADGRHVKVVVQHMRADVWRCVSAFPVSSKAFADACRSRRARWPP